MSRPKIPLHMERMSVNIAPALSLKYYGILGYHSEAFKESLPGKYVFNCT